MTQGKGVCKGHQSGGDPIFWHMNEIKFEEETVWIRIWCFWNKGSFHRRDEFKCGTQLLALNDHRRIYKLKSREGFTYTEEQIFVVGIGTEIR